MPPLSMIVAIARNGVIGNGGGLPWSYPEDRRHYLERTSGHAILMGRRTFEETGQVRPDCRNIVISSKMAARAGVEIFPSLDLALEAARRTDGEPMIIGGVRVFREAFERITRIWLTSIPIEPVGDTTFDLDRSAFVVASERHGEGGVTFLELTRR